MMDAELNPINLLTAQHLRTVDAYVVVTPVHLLMHANVNTGQETLSQLDQSAMDIINRLISGLAVTIFRI